MLHELSGSEGNAIGLQADGPLSVADYKEWVPKLAALAEAHGGKLRVLFEMSGFEGWDSIAAFWEELKGDVALVGKVERLAVIAHGLGDRISTEIADVILPGKVKAFDPEEVSEAWAWLKAE